MVNTLRIDDMFSSRSSLSNLLECKIKIMMTILSIVCLVSTIVRTYGRIALIGFRKGVEIIETRVDAL
jgi:hypothetical protein